MIVYTRTIQMLQILPSVIANPDLKKKKKLKKKTKEKTGKGKGTVVSIISVWKKQFFVISFGWYIANCDLVLYLFLEILQSDFCYDSSFFCLIYQYQIPLESNDNNRNTFNDRHIHQSTLNILFSIPCLVNEIFYMVAVKCFFF